MRALQTDRERAREIANATLTSQGATYLFSGDRFVTTPERLFIVGGAQGVPVVRKPLVGFGSVDVYRQLVAAREAGADGVGTWVDAGNVYVDAIDTFRYVPTALEVARERGELAIWDAYRQEEIRVPASEDAS
jgi:hypothetical protein